MEDHSPMRFAPDAHVSVPNVRAPACPIDDGATWLQVLVSFAGLPLFLTLVIAGLTTDPVSYLGAGLAIVGLASSTFVFVGVLRSRLTPRGSSHPRGRGRRRPR